MRQGARANLDFSLVARETATRLELSIWRDTEWRPRLSELQFEVYCVAHHKLHLVVVKIVRTDVVQISAGQFHSEAVL